MKTQNNLILLILALAGKKRLAKFSESATKEEKPSAETPDTKQDVLALTASQKMQSQVLD